jgi:hypothetical protein
MINAKVLSAAAVMAVVLPMAAPTASFAQNHYGRGGSGAPAARISGGVGAAGMRGGGVSAPAAQFNAGAAGARSAGVSAPAVAQFNRGGAGYRTAGVTAPAVAQFNGGAYRGGYGGGYYRHRDHDRDRFFPGVVAGAVVGGALAADSYAYYGGPAYYGPGYYDDSYYDDGAVVAAEPAPVGDDSVAYCMQRYRSYDPASGTYLGNDGLRHSCP